MSKSKFIYNTKLTRDEFLKHQANVMFEKELEKQRKKNEKQEVSEQTMLVYLMSVNQNILPYLKDTRILNIVYNFYKHEEKKKNEAVILLKENKDLLHKRTIVFKEFMDYAIYEILKVSYKDNYSPNDIMNIMVKINNIPKLFKQYMMETGKI